jgi:transposase
MDKSKLERRKSIIKLMKKGKKRSEISYLLDVPLRTVSYWIVRYEKTGSLEDKPRPGKVPKLTRKQFDEVKDHFLNYSPDRYGGESLGWTTKLAIKHVKDSYGVVYSVRRMQELFHIFGLSLVTPRSEAKRGSKLARNAFRDEFKKNLNKNIWVAKSSISTKQHSDSSQ